MMSPAIKTITIAPVSVDTNGKAKAKGAAPKIENQMTYLRLKRSPNRPPITVPMAKAAKKANKQS